MQMRDLSPVLGGMFWATPFYGKKTKHMLPRAVAALSLEGRMRPGWLSFSCCSLLSFVVRGSTGLPSIQGSLLPLPGLSCQRRRRLLHLSVEHPKQRPTQRQRLTRAPRDRVARGGIAQARVPRSDWLIFFPFTSKLFFWNSPILLFGSR